MEKIIYEKKFTVTLCLNNKYLKYLMNLFSLQNSHFYLSLHYQGTYYSFINWAKDVFGRN